jgi:hypothetical protein
MRQFGLFQVCVVVAGLAACGGSEDAEATASGPLDTEQASLVAALAANEDGSDEAWTSASGAEPFLVESCGFDVIVQRAVERFDADGSGDLDADERAALVDEFGDPSDRLELLVSVYDADGSGSLEAGELDVLKQDLEARCENLRSRLLAGLDANGDGTLDEAEREAARAALKDRFAARHAARLGEFDGNGDGRLGPLERRRAGASIRSRVEARRGAIAEDFDADGNGELDANERAALVEHLRRCVRGEVPLAPAEPSADAGADTTP